VLRLSTDASNTLTIAQVDFALSPAAVLALRAQAARHLLHGNDDSTPIFDSGIATTVSGALNKHSHRTGARTGLHRLLGGPIASHRLCPLPGTSVPMRTQDPTLLAARQTKTSSEQRPRPRGQLSMEQTCIEVTARDYQLDVGTLRKHSAWRTALDSLTP
jgi:hypothetical protein